MDPLGSKPPKILKNENSQIDILPQKHPIGRVPIYVMREVSRQPSQKSIQKDVKIVKNSQNMQPVRTNQSGSVISEEELKVNHDSSVERTID